MDLTDLKQFSPECALDLNKISALLKTEWLGRPTSIKNEFQNELWNEIDSTNERALFLARGGAPKGLMVIARQQTAGRGRLRRSWYSPMDAGLYISFLLRPSLKAKALPLITLASGWATAQAIRATTDLAIGLKWVNDLVLSKRKIGGILAELGNSQDQSHPLVVGIGINIDKPITPIPAEVVDKMAWLQDFCDRPIDRNLLISQIAFELESAINSISEGNIAPILDGWRSYSVTLGEEVSVVSGEQVHKGVALDITDGGALIVNTRHGRQEFHAGEVSIRRADGQYV